MKLFTFNHGPTFAELWDACVYNLLYNVQEYKKELESLFQKLGITRDSSIIDVSAGGGFPAIELAEDGYTITATDGFADEVALFNKKALSAGVLLKCKEVLWADLPLTFPSNCFDLLFCRGNSFIYAGGGWNEVIDISSEKSLLKYMETLSIFYSLLKQGGWIYVDKFKDTETSHRETIGQVQVLNGKPENLIFWTERYSDKKMRQASVIRETEIGEKKIFNIAYDLLGSELEAALRQVGFKNIEKMSFKSEKIFDTWVAQK